MLLLETFRKLMNNIKYMKYANQYIDDTMKSEKQQGERSFPMKKIRIAILGLGTVGSQLLVYIRRNLKYVQDRYDVNIILTPVFVRDLQKKRAADLSGITLTDDPFESIKDADIVIDCMGGNSTGLTRELILSSLRDQRSVILSSKKCLAFYGRELLRVAKENHADLCFDATVGGCIPVYATLEQMGRCEQINRISGICNATSNYILGKMAKNVSYEDALTFAVADGLAENDPAEDVDGWDTVYKSVILAGFGMGKWEDPRSVIPESIREISTVDFRRAEDNHQVIKPLFTIERQNQEIHFRVGPRPISKDSILATVKDNHNIFVFESSESGERTFIGQGAGARPTASAIFDDLSRLLIKK